MDLIPIFLTGLLAGGLTCLAVQGGLLASSIAHQEEERLEEVASRTGYVIPVLSFLITRLAAYTILGGLLGLIGSAAQLSLSARVILQLFVVVFMVGTALNLLQVHPIFRYFVIQPPRFLTRYIKNQSKSKSVFGPALLGFFTILIPCGATQAMMAYAITTGSAFAGALTMFIFILGTSPLFFLLGYATRRLGSNKRASLDKVVAVAILVVAFYNLTGALSLSGIPLSFAKPTIIEQQVKGTVSDTTSAATIYFTQTGYVTDPPVINVKANAKVKLTLVNKNGAGCIQAFTIPRYGIQQVLPVGKSVEISITTPKMSGTIPFMCSMGMYQGAINVM